MVTCIQDFVERHEGHDRRQLTLRLSDQMAYQRQKPAAIGVKAPGAVSSTGSLTGTAQGGTSTPFRTVQPTIGLQLHHADYLIDLFRKDD